jgi:hypothetical protein
MRAGISRMQLRQFVSRMSDAVAVQRRRVHSADRHASARAVVVSRAGRAARRGTRAAPAADDGLVYRCNSGS